MADNMRIPVDITTPISKRRTDLSASLDEGQRQLKVALRPLWRLLPLCLWILRAPSPLGKDYEGNTHLVKTGKTSWIRTWDTSWTPFLLPQTNSALGFQKALGVVCGLRGYLQLRLLKQNIQVNLFLSLELFYNLPDLIFQVRKRMHPKAFAEKLDCNNKWQPDVPEPPFFWLPSHSVFRRHLKSVIPLERTKKYVRRWAPIQQNWLECFLIPGK